MNYEARAGWEIETLRQLIEATGDDLRFFTGTRMLCDDPESFDPQVEKAQLAIRAMSECLAVEDPGDEEESLRGEAILTRPPAGCGWYRVHLGQLPPLSGTGQLWLQLIDAFGERAHHMRAFEAWEMHHNRVKVVWSDDPGAAITARHIPEAGEHAFAWFRKYPEEDAR